MKHRPKDQSESHGVFFPLSPEGLKGKKSLSGRPEIHDRPLSYSVFIMKTRLVPAGRQGTSPKRVQPFSS